MLKAAHQHLYLVAFLLKPTSRVAGIRNAEEKEWTATAPAIFWECKEFLKMPLMIIETIIIEHLEKVKAHLEVASDHLKPL